MYQRFYQLTTNPFRLAPEPNFCFGHTGYRRAREYLEYALNQGEGFVLVTGRPGTGKTMLVETFLKETDISRAVARRIAVANYGAEDLLRAVAYAYGIDAEGLDRSTTRHRIQQYFIEQERIGRRVLLIIDEAQALQHAALEELRILADLQTQSRLMLQLFLVGQESLQELMRTPEMEQFQQRVIANYQIVPLSLLDTRNYIEHRLLQAGWTGDPEFSSAAVIRIYQLSKGVPRHINKICSRLLLLGFGNSSHLFNEADVQKISAEMRNENLAPLDNNQASQSDAENITNLAEVRDGKLADVDLAIRVDRVDTKIAGIPEAVRLAAMHKAEFESRHQADRRAELQGDELTLSSGEKKPDFVGLEPVQVICEPDTTRQRNSSQPVVPSAGRTRWTRVVVVVAAIFASATILLAAMPSILDKLDTNSLLAVLKKEASDAYDRFADTAETTGVPDKQIAVPQQLDKPLSEPVEAVASGAITRSTDEAALPAIDMEKSGPVTDAPDEAISEAAVIESFANEVNTDNVAHIIPDERVADLLVRGQQAMDEYRMMTPEQDNAYYYFTAARQLDPENTVAQAGIQQIVDIYIILAGKEVDKGEYARAGRYIDRGLTIQPGNVALMSIKQQIEGGADGVIMTHPQSSSIARDEKQTMDKDAMPPARTGEQPDNTVVLQKRQAADRRRQVSYTPDKQ